MDYLFDTTKLSFCTPRQANIISFLFQENPQYNEILGRLMAWIISSKSIDSLRGKLMQTKGHVQSGKSNFMRIFSILCATFGIPSLIVVRNLTDDAEQLARGYTDLLKRLVLSVPDANIKFGGSDSMIQIVLSNAIALKKNLNKKEYVLIIDENDAVDSTEKAEKTRCLTLLKQNSFCYMGVTATSLDPLLKDNITPEHIFVLPTPDGYKGIHDIMKCTKILSQKAIFSGGVKDDLINNNPEWIELLDTILARPLMKTNTHYPHIWLSNMGRTIQPYLSLQQTLCRTHPTLTTLVYNGKGVTMSLNGQLPVLYKKSIAWCLQWLKTNGGALTYPHIMIFSGELAGRGISFTDMDYEWHLTGMYLVSSDKTDEVELIQKIRLCGIYKDDLPLELHTTQSIKTDIEKAYLRQEELMHTMMKRMDGFRDTLHTITMHKEKFTKRHTTKHQPLGLKRTKKASEAEWNVSVYQGVELPPPEYYELQSIANPTEEEREQWKKEHHVEEEEIESEQGEWFIEESDMGSDLERRTYQHILTYFEENYNAMVFRAKITSYIKEQELCKDDVARSRIEKVFDHKKQIVVKDGFCIRKQGKRWMVRKV